MFEERKTKKAQLLSAMKQEIAHTTPVHQKTFWQRLADQLEYISTATWIWQCFVLLGIIILSMFTFINIISSVMPLIGITLGTEIIRSYGYGTWELEMSCRYSLRETTAMKLIILGTIDIIVCITAITVTGIWGSFGATEAMLVLVPFNISSAVYLLLIAKLQKRCTNYLLMGVGILLTVGSLLINRSIINEDRFTEIITAQPVAMGITIISIGAVCLCVGFLLQSTEKGEKKWNYV